MAYKIPSTPGKQDYIEAIADFWEVRAILSPGKPISSLAISKLISFELDELNHSGIESEGDTVDQRVNEVFDELRNRRSYTNGNYPFGFKTSSIFLNTDDSFLQNAYLYLLLCTRFNMQKHKKQNNIDGTLLFEQLCIFVASSYFGVSQDDCYLFGTANSEADEQATDAEKLLEFERKIRALISRVGEGDSFKNPNKNSPTKNDDSLDVVVWKNFADNRPSKLIAFGQCKTGTSWRKTIHTLKPRDFWDNWFMESPIIHPIPLIFLTDTLYENFNIVTDTRGFLCFNRFRIMEHLREDILDDIECKVRLWVEGALNTLRSLHKDM